jgi:hypothetical protein
MRRSRAPAWGRVTERGPAWPPGIGRDAARAELLPFASKKCPLRDTFGEVIRCMPDFAGASPGGYSGEGPAPRPGGVLRKTARCGAG